MKNFFFILVMVFWIGLVNAVQPARKPFIQVKMDGKSIKSGEIHTVTPGQKLLLEVELEGGRRDFCKFPDTYSDLAGRAQILARGEKGITYQLEGKVAEWKLLSEKVVFTSDEFIKSNATADQWHAELTVSKDKFSQSFVKTTINAMWQLTVDGNVSTEMNTAEVTTYFKIAGTSDLWFSSQNIDANGIKNENVMAKLNTVQAACDSIKSNIYKLQFQAVQQSIRNLQIKVNDIKSTTDSIKSTNASYKANVIFKGLPTDEPFQDINLFATIKSNWASLESLTSVLQQQLANLPAEPTQQNKDELIAILTKFSDWQYKLPDNTFKILPRYITDLNFENVRLPGDLQFIAEEKSVPDYTKSKADFKAFLEQRIEQIPVENEKINSTQSRLQAIRLFDGMLRSYFSSIVWAEWKSIRGY